MCGCALNSARGTSNDTCQTSPVPHSSFQGKQDEYGTDRQVNTLLAALGGRCESVMLERCGHSPHLDQRATVEDLMIRFVRGLTGNSF
jgi:pimeloyl-ACP methyl ester carboxylesterase